jgi:hypothetical protein
LQLILFLQTAEALLILRSMSQEHSGSESALWEMMALDSAVADQMALNDRVYEATAKALGRIAQEHYPKLKDWEPEQLRKLADRIARHSTHFWQELESLDYASEQSQRQQGFGF